MKSVEFQSIEEHQPNDTSSSSSSASISISTTAADNSSSNSFQCPQLSEMNKVLLVHLNILVYAYCYWIVDPLMPYILKDLGGSSTSLGYFKSYFNLVQLAGGLVVGLLQDRYSGAMALSLTQVGSFLVYSSYAFASSISWLYVARVLTVLQQSMQVAQAYISKTCVGNEERSISLGRLSLSYGTGMILGGFSGGYLLKLLPATGPDGNTLGPIIIGASLSLIMAILNMQFLDRVSLKDNEKKKDDSNPGHGKKHNYWTLLVQLKYIALFLTMISATRSLYEPIFTMTMVDKYEIPRAQLGQVMSYFAGVGLFSNVVVMPMVLVKKDATSRWFPLFGGMRDVTLIRCAIIGGGGAYAAVAFGLAPTAYTYMALFTILTISSSLFYTLATSFISSNTPSSVHGQTVAMSHALRSAVGTVCPMLGSEIMSRFSGDHVAGVNVVLLIAAFIVMSFAAK